MKFSFIHKLILPAALAFMVYGCGQKQEAARQPEAMPAQNTAQEAAPPAAPISLNIGDAAPAFTMNGPDGKPISLADFKGKVVMLDFWATWCPPCVRSIPHVKELWAQYKDKDFVILGVSLDRDLDKWSTYIKDQNMSWPQVSDGKYWENAAAMQYQIESIPSVWILDKQGRIVLKNMNPLAEAESIEKTIQNLLAAAK
jgi:peroxiredoxin